MTRYFYSLSRRGLLSLAVAAGLMFMLSDLSDARPAKRKNIEKEISRLMAHEYVPGEIIVKYKGETELKKGAERMRQRVGAGLKRRVGRQRTMEVIKLRPGKSMKNALDAYLRDPGVAFAEPNYFVYTALRPDDPEFAALWGLHNTGQTGGAIDADIDAPEAWGITTGSDDVVIAVIDTGINFDHPDLAANIWTNIYEQPGDANGDGCPGLCNVDDDGDGLVDEDSGGRGPLDPEYLNDMDSDDDENGYADDFNGWDFVQDDNDPSDLTGHGTLMAGTIAATGNNGRGISGVMWRAKIMPLRALGLTGAGTTADVIDAIHYANEQGADVINNSWGVDGLSNFSQALKDAIDASGAVVVCAAGNGGDDEVGDDIDSPFGLHLFFPASYTSANIIAVAATDHDDGIASYSNYGFASVDVGAPGHSIYSTIPELSLGPPVTVYGEETFDSASGDLSLLGWSRGGTHAAWAVTSGTGANGSNSLEDSPGTDYLENTDSWAGYMTPVPSMKDNIYTLTFRWKGDMESYVDAFRINYSLDGAAWNVVEKRIAPTGGVFISDGTDLFTEIAERFDSFYFGFGIYSDSTVNRDGIYIDNVMLVREPVQVTDSAYMYFDATSMAAAHVSGVAGLIKAFNPQLTNAEIKNAILSSVDPVPSLAGKILTGGRVNAFAALEAACAYLPVQNMNTLSQYLTVQDAYNAAGSGDTLRVQTGVFNLNITAGTHKSVVLEGGFDCNYENVIGTTRIAGTMLVSDGTVIPSGISIE